VGGGLQRSAREKGEKKDVAWGTRRESKSEGWGTTPSMPGVENKDGRGKKNVRSLKKLRDAVAQTIETGGGLRRKVLDEVSVRWNGNDDVEKKKKPKRTAISKKLSFVDLSHGINQDPARRLGCDN